MAKFAGLIEIVLWVCMATAAADIPYFLAHPVERTAFRVKVSCACITRTRFFISKNKPVP